jgi:twitching motility protein PilJ
MKNPFSKKSPASAVQQQDLQATVEIQAAAVAPRASGGIGVMRYSLPALLLVLVVTTIAVFVLAAEQALKDTKLFAVMDRQQVLSQTVSKEGSEASKGREASFKRLERAADAFDQALLVLSDGDLAAPIQGLPDDPAVRTALASLGAEWQPLRENVNRMLEARQAVLSVQAGAQDFDRAKARLVGAIEDFVQAMADSYVSADQMALASQMLMLTERLSESLQRTLGGGAQAAVAADRFQRDSVYMRHLIDGFSKGEYVFGVRPVETAKSQAALQKLDETYKKTEALIEEIYGFSFRLLNIQDAASDVLSQSDTVLERAEALRAVYQTHIDSRPISNALGATLGGFAMLMLLLIGLQSTLSARREAAGERESAIDARSREVYTRELNRQNQEAILRLLDEISDLADGDLTTNATVTEDITGAIADAINYAIDALRETVTNINSVSVEVASEARRTRKTAVNLSSASETQAAQIRVAAESIDALASAARTVSANAERSREVAQQSVQYANDGTDAVRATIDGMDNIRETMQETSKRIKRLGESSQEIGEIVGLIDDIADQTNILALNAAIQASMAGEQGRGFAVVADEVQRLAERASHATKQIEALVKAIQSDTNEAVNSMEQSTAGVVQGAALAEDAGQALVRIEIVSQEMAELIAAISDSSAGQTQQADTTNDTMAEISNITAATSSGTQETAASIGRLAQLAADLRTSVAGFRLPDSSQPASAAIVGFQGDEAETLVTAPGETPQAAHGA